MLITNLKCFPKSSFCQLLTVLWKADLFMFFIHNVSVTKVFQTGCRSPSTGGRPFRTGLKPGALALVVNMSSTNFHFFSKNLSYKQHLLIIPGLFSRNLYTWTSLWFSQAKYNKKKQQANVCYKLTELLSRVKPSLQLCLNPKSLCDNS